MPKDDENIAMMAQPHAVGTRIETMLAYAKNAVGPGQGYVLSLLNDDGSVRHVQFPPPVDWGEVERVARAHSKVTPTEKKNK